MNIITLNDIVRLSPLLTKGQVIRLIKAVNGD